MNEYDILKRSLVQVKEELNNKKAKLKVLEDRKKELELLVEEENKKREVKRNACILISSVTKRALEEVSHRFENTVTPILEHVLGNGYALKIKWSQSSNKMPSAEFLVKSPFKSGDSIYVNPRFRGGGVRDVVGFSLRFAFLSMANNKGFIVLDESFSQLDRGKRWDLSQILKYIQKKLGNQIIFITHDEEYANIADLVITVSNTGCRSTIYYQ